MKKLTPLLMLILLAGCDYEIPLSQTGSETNPALAGNWSDSATNETIALRISLSSNAYSIVYGDEKDAMRFTGLEVRAGDLKLVQLELQDAKNTDLYTFAKYELGGDSLTVQMVNSDVVSGDCRTTEELRADFAVHRNNPKLFKDPMIFVRSAHQ